MISALVIFLCFFVPIYAINLTSIFHIIDHEANFKRSVSKKDITIQFFIPFYVGLKKTYIQYKNL